MKALGIIIARGGSKGIPGKNLRVVHGKKLVQWPVLAAVRSERFARVVLSTDSPELRQAGQEAGAEVPFLRPSELASDSANAVDVVKHALSHFEANGERFDAVVLLQPTSPLVLGSDIDKAIALLAEGFGSVICLSSLQHVHPDLCYRAEGQKAVPLRSTAPGRRQDRESLMFRTGTLYAAKTESLVRDGTFLGPSLGFIEIPPHRALAIDDEFDLFLADHYFDYCAKKGEL